MTEHASAGIVVENASYNMELGMSSDPAFESTTLNPRICIEYASIVSNNPLIVSNGLLNDTALVDSRVKFEYAGQNFGRTLEFPQGLINDTETPLITNLTVSNITENSAVIKWDTDELSNSLVKYDNEQGTYSESKFDPMFVKNHTIKLNDLSPDTYYFIVYSTDQSGNMAQSSEQMFTTYIVKIIIDSVGTVDDATKNWKWSTDYHKPVFRRGIDNPRIHISVKPETGRQVQLVVYDSNNNKNTLKSFLSKGEAYFYYKWNNYQTISEIPVGIWEVKAFIEGQEIGNETFYVIFDFDKMDDGAFTTRDKDTNFGRKLLTAQMPWTENLHQYESQVWTNAIHCINGETDIQEAVSKIAILTRTINGESTYHHLGYNEMEIFSNDGYDNDFDHITDLDENWEHNYAPSSNDLAGIWIKDLSDSIGSFYWNKAWLIREDDDYWYQKQITCPHNVVEGSNYHDTLDFLNSDVRPYNQSGEKQLESEEIRDWPHHPVGVCEDYAMLTVSYLRSIGIPAKMVSGLPLLWGAGHSWLLYYDDVEWNHLDTDYFYNKRFWENYFFDKKVYLIGKNSFVDRVFTEKYENGEVCCKEITTSYKPDIEVTLESYDPDNGELKITAYYPSKHESELSFTGDYKVFFRVYNSSNTPLLNLGGSDESSNIELSPGESKTTYFNLDINKNPIHQDEDIIAKAFAYHTNFNLYDNIVKGNISIGSSPWTRASSIWLTTSSQDTELVKYEIQNEETKEILNCSVFNVSELKPGDAGSALVSVNNTGSESKTVNLVIGMKTAEPVIGNAPTPILVGNKSLYIPANSTLVTDINLSIPDYFSPDSYVLVLAPYNESGALYMKNYTVKIIPNFGVNISKPNDVILGESFNLTVSVKNYDGAPINNLTAKLNLHHYFNTAMNMTKYLPYLNVGELYSFNWTLSPTNYGDLNLDVTVYSDSGFTTKSVDLNSLSTPKLWIAPELPDEVNKGENFSLEVSVFNSGDIATDNVTLNLDNTPPNVTANRTNTNLGVIEPKNNKSCSYNIQQNEDGNFTILLTASSSKANTSNYAFVVVNQPPNANFNHLPKNPVCSQVINFNATNSYDLDGNIIVYSWEFGDGNSTAANDSVTNHTYSAPDCYQVYLTVTDDDGLTNSSSKPITVGCGDVNCDQKVDISDVIKLLYYVGYPDQYSLCSEWTGDVTGDGTTDISDVIRLLYYVGYPGQYELNCKC